VFKMGFKILNNGKYGIMDILKYFDDGYCVIKGDGRWLLCIHDLWVSDSQLLNMHGRAKIVSNPHGEHIFLFLLDPTGKRRLHELGIKPVPSGTISITIKQDSGGMLFDCWVPATFNDRLKFVKSIYSVLNGGGVMK